MPYLVSSIQKKLTSGQATLPKGADPKIASEWTNLWVLLRGGHDIIRAKHATFTSTKIGRAQRAEVMKYENAN